ncbi:protein tyrosine phosphatase family protein [Arcobacter sp. KX21116]|uniref:protein tyrosine phosphatase family protein n=1 Tax=Arcobacter iocasae TaxID=2906515 RepID=UPI0035D43CF0
MKTEAILNYIKINDNISTAGQPKEAELEVLANDGFEVVINLALSSATNALENEDKIVSNLGMTYIHLPVDFEYPTKDDLKLFLTLLTSLEGKKVFVHCALNYRVSAFMYVYHKYFLKTPFDEIDLSLLEEWKPSPIWQDILKIEFEELS